MRLKGTCPQKTHLFPHLGLQISFATYLLAMWIFLDIWCRCTISITKQIQKGAKFSPQSDEFWHRSPTWLSLVQVPSSEQANSQPQSTAASQGREMYCRQSPVASSQYWWPTQFESSEHCLMHLRSANRLIWKTSKKSQNWVGRVLNQALGVHQSYSCTLSNSCNLSTSSWSWQSK